MAGGVVVDPKDYRFKAVDTALEWSKQIITLSTGTLVLTGTFLKDIFTGSTSHDPTIVACWISMSLASVTGIFFLGGITAMLNKADDASKVDVFKPMSRVLALVHMACFIAGLIFFIIYINANLKSFTTRQGTTSQPIAAAGTQPQPPNPSTAVPKNLSQPQPPNPSTAVPKSP